MRCANVIIGKESKVGSLHLKSHVDGRESLESANVGCHQFTFNELKRALSTVEVNVESATLSPTGENGDDLQKGIVLQASVNAHIRTFEIIEAEYLNPDPNNEGAHHDSNRLGIAKIPYG
jgi:hypothetical protein